MVIEKKITSDLAIPPGEYLAEVLETKSISQAEIARRMGRPPQAINEIIRGKKAITAETAILLERTLGVPAHIWTGLEAQYRLTHAKQTEKTNLERELPFLKEIPYSHLSKLGFVKSTRNKMERLRELQNFFGVSSLRNMECVKAYGPAFRCARKQEASAYALAAWIKAGEVSGRKIQTEPFSKQKLENSLSDIKELTLKMPGEFMPQLKNIFSSVGIAFVIMPHFPKTYAQGATFWLEAQKAVLMMSIRGSWADIFWFSLFHEIAHIILHDKRMVFIEIVNIKPEMAQQEEEADKFAASKLIPSESYQELLKSSINEKIIKSFAKRIGIQPGIIVGRLQYDGYISQNSLFNKIRERYKWTTD